MLGCNCIKKKPQHECFRVNIVEFLRKAFIMEKLRWLLLKNNKILQNLLKVLFRAEAATRGVLLEKVFLEISQNSQEDTCDGDTFSHRTPPMTASVQPLPQCPVEKLIFSDQSSII